MTVILSVGAAVCLEAGEAKVLINRALQELQTVCRSRRGFEILVIKEGAVTRLKLPQED
jgi:hypothetical protein